MQQHINISQPTSNILQTPVLTHGLSSLDQNGHHHHYFESIKNKWNTNQEIADILYAAQSDPNSQCIANHILPRPTSGTQFIFPRYDGSWFKNDEFIWRRRKEGKLVREDHMKLKVNKQQLISANYVHSAIVPTFHRRAYWLTQIPGFVLVHYLNESNMDKGTRKTAESIAECMKTNNVRISHAQLFEQLTPIYAHCLKPDEVHLLANAVFDVLQIENQQDPQPSISSGETKQFQLERRNSCSSAFRKGLSSIALRRQPSANSEIDANYIGTMMKKYGCCESPTEKMNLCVCGPSTSSINRPNSNSTAVESRSPSGETERRSSNLDEDMSIYQQNSVKSSTNGTSPGMDLARGVMTSSISSANNNNNQHSISSPSTVSLTPIVDISPSSASVKGGEKVLLIGAWYMKGHQYKVSFGSRGMVRATLIQAGVLSVIVPPGLKPETVSLQVFCNDQPVSTIRSFIYEKPVKNGLTEDDSKKNEEVAQQIFEKLRILAYSLNAYTVFENLNSFVCDELSLIGLVHQIDQHFGSSSNPVIHHQLLCGSSQFPVKTILHLTASLDFDRLFESLVILSRRLPYFREFDVISRDSDGCTPLHIASQNGSLRVARYIISLNQSTVDVIDDRGRTPSDYAHDYKIAAAIEEKNLDEDFDGHVNATELWVLTNGETVTREHLLLSKLTKATIATTEERTKDRASSCSMVSDFGGDVRRRALFQGTSREYDDDCDSCCDVDDDSNNRQLHVEISMDTDVLVPDSPKMARLFHVVTSPGVMVTDNARAKMADLARQIIDALPDRIKRNTDVVGSFFDEDDAHHHAFTTRHNPMLSQNNVSCETSMDSTCNVVDELYEMMVVDGHPHSHNHHSQISHSISEPRFSETVGTSRSANLFASSHEERSFASCSTRANTFESETLDFDKDLGEFFTVNADSRIDPIQHCLDNLKYNDDEQREVYEAAMVIQRAYREYRARNTSRRQEDIERKAALKIQGCYRRYKQFCYFKKLHNAAIVVQKHFRMRKKDDKEEGVGEDVTVPEHPTLDGQSIRIQVPQNNSSLLREHRAATTIQLAYRGHRKRQAAARKIQNFMRQSRNKLRRMHAQNEDGMLSVQDQNRVPEHNQQHQLLAKSQSDAHNPIQHQPHLQQQQQQQQQLIRRENLVAQTGNCCLMTGSLAQQQPQQPTSSSQMLNLDHSRIINGTN